MSVRGNGHSTSLVSHTGKKRRIFYFNRKSCVAMVMSAALLFTSVDCMTVHAEELADMVPPVVEEEKPETPGTSGEEENTKEEPSEQPVTISAFQALSEEESCIKFEGEKQALEDVLKDERIPKTLTAYVAPAASVSENTPEGDTKPGEGETKPDEGDQPGEGETKPDEGDQPGEGETKPDEGDQPGEGETKPGEGDQPGEGETKPGEGDQPGEGETKPGEGDQPGEGETKPGEEVQPGGGETESGEGDQPGTGSNDDQGVSDSGSGGADDGGTGGGSDTGEGSNSSGSGEEESQNMATGVNDVAAGVKSVTFAQDGQVWRLLVETGESGDDHASDEADSGSDDEKKGGADSGADDNNGGAGGSDGSGSAGGSEGSGAGETEGGAGGNEGSGAGETEGNAGGNEGSGADETEGGAGGSEGSGAGETEGGAGGNEGSGAGETEGGTGGNEGGGAGGTEGSTGGNEGGSTGGTEGGVAGDTEGSDGTGAPGTGEGENTPPGIETGDGTDVPAVEKPDTVLPADGDASETVEIPVTWNCDTYETEEADSYIFVPEWDEEKWVLAESGKDTIPTIEVVYVKPESMVSTEEELVAAFEAGIGRITLQNDIALTKSLKLPATADITLDGQGYSLLRGKVIAEGEEGQSAEIFSGIMIAMEGEDYTEDTYGTLTLKNITVNGGTEANRADGPAILDRGNLILDEDAVVRNNYNYGTYPKEGEGEKETVPDYGGGIQVYGKLTLSPDALVTENFADEFGGGVYLGDGATLYLYADKIVENDVSEDAGYGADLYAAKGSTIYYDPSFIDMKEKREKGLYYICSGVKLFRLGEGDQEPEQEDTNKELYIYVDKNSGYDDTQIAELKDALRMYGYTILEGRTDIDTSDLQDWYVYDHYDTACWGEGSTDNPPSEWSAAYPSDGSQKRNFYPCTEKYVGVSHLNTIEAWLEYGFKSLARFKEHIYVRKEGGDTAMTFVGYGVLPHVDFMYYNPNSDGEKVVDFDVNSVSIDTHTLLGNGFLVNTGVGADGNMSGYLILYRYIDTPVGALASRLELYRILGTPEDLHEGPLINAAHLIDSWPIDSSEWQNQMSVQIRVTPKRIAVRQQPYGVGKDISQTEPVLEYSIEDVSGYSGFGPLVAYGPHACSSASSFTYSDLCMYYTNPQMEKTNLLSPLEKADFTQEGTQKYFIDLFGQAERDFNPTMNMGDLYHEYMKLMQTEGVALVTDRKTPFAEYLGEADGSGSNLYELGEGGALPAPKMLAEQIYERIKDKTSTRLEGKVNRGDLLEPEPKSSAGNICLQSGKTGEQIRETLYGDDFAEGGYQIQVIDDGDIAYIHEGPKSASYEILKPNAVDYETLGNETMGSGFSFTIPKAEAERAQWPAGVYTVRQIVEGSGIDGYAYFTLKWRTAPPPTYRVTVNVRKDGSPWTDHGKNFWLRDTKGGTYTCGQVVTGTYTVLENYTNTGVRVTVANRNTTVTLDYYTVTFYDREPDDPDTRPYAENTMWGPRIVLQGKNVGIISQPLRDKYNFDGWVTEKGTPFNANSQVVGTTEVYATWSRNVKVNVNVRKDNNSWDDHGRVFRLLAEGGTELIRLSDLESEGKYIVYDVTGLEDVISPREDRNTGETVVITAEEANTPGTLKEATVDYYTVSFYDENTENKKLCEMGEESNPQVVLKNQHAVRPAFDPSMDKRVFDGWVTKEGTAFGFDGQAIAEPTEVYAKWLYPVSVKVKARKDNEDAEWLGHGKKFMLRPEGGGALIGLSEAVFEGKYTVCEVEELAEDGTLKKGVDTGVWVEVENADKPDTEKEVAVDYCTVTFYDAYPDGVRYGDDTDQAQQIVLKGGKAMLPSAPQKDKFSFIGWVSGDGTAEGKAFDFGQTEINEPVRIYAKWEKVEEPRYKVEIEARKDGGEWSDADRKFALRPEGGDGQQYIFDLEQVKNGTYRIYDITGAAPAAYGLRAVGADANVKVDDGDTGVTITVENKDEAAAVDYYTVTFYDGTAAYGTDTPQSPMVVLSGKTAAEPSAPSKADHYFAGWKTGSDGGTAFDFSQAVRAKTDIYAGWTPVPVYTITATAGNGGQISPAGAVRVNEGKEQTFTITPNKEYHIKAVKVDETDVTDLVTGTDNSYTFRDVREDHTIAASFVANKMPESDKKSKSSPDDDGGGEDTQTVTVSQEAAPQAADSQPAPQAPGGKEPKTGDSVPVEIYATVAMVAGLTYLLLYFMEESRGMTEREKEVFVAAFIRWAKKGGRFRRCCAVVAIFCLLVYYHSIGKRAGRSEINREYLKQAL